MANSTCPKCPNTSFELKEFVPRGSNFKLFAVQCSSCGAVVSTIPFTNTSIAIDALKKELKEELRNIQSRMR